MLPHKRMTTTVNWAKYITFCCQFKYKYAKYKLHQLLQSEQSTLEFPAVSTNISYWKTKLKVRANEITANISSKHSVKLMSSYGQIPLFPRQFIICRGGGTLMPLYSQEYPRFFSEHINASIYCYIHILILLGYTWQFLLSSAKQTWCMQLRPTSIFPANGY
jgi:hypothetical protein